MAASDRAYAKGLGRAFGGAVVFSFPLAMTMEMWELGFAMDEWRLALFIVINLVVLVGISHLAGFEETSWWSDDVMDAFAAFAVGVIAATLLLAVIGVIAFGMSTDEIVGKIAMESVPASIGAMLSRKQLGVREADTEKDRRDAGYAGEIFLMAVGALFLAFNIAPTEEVVVIAQKMNPWHALAMVIASILLLQVFVYAVGFAGQEEAPHGAPFRAVLFHYSIAGYGVALLVSLYVLWIFGRTDGTSWLAIAQMTVVLGLPAALGAALARLIT